MNCFKQYSFAVLNTLIVSLLVALPVLKAQTTDAQTSPLTDNQKLARDIFRELIEINTTHSFGSTKAAEAMAARLKAAGFLAEDVLVLGPRPNKGNLVARLRGKGKEKPILLLAHLDVVEARREDWSFDPFKFLERDGYFYGRGTSDIKEEAADLVANLIRLKKEGFVPDRDIILALTEDEEAAGDANGVDWLLANHRNLIDAEYCINTDAGGGDIRNGLHMLVEMQTSEKVFLSFLLEVKNRGGHSSLPIKDNAIYHLAQGLTRLSDFDFPVKLNETTRTFFERMSVHETGQVAKDMEAMTRTPLDVEAVTRLAASSAYYNALMRTTCVATRLEGGHAENALPQIARATVNCRILPNELSDGVQSTLENVLADKQIKISRIEEPRPSPLSSLRRDVVQAVEQITSAMWPGVTVAPVMSTGATDGLYLRRVGISVYGVSGMFFDIDDVRAHGRDERIGVKEFYEGVEFMYRLIKSLTSGK